MNNNTINFNNSKYDKSQSLSNTKINNINKQKSGEQSSSTNGNKQNLFENTTFIESVLSDKRSPDFQMENSDLYSKEYLMYLFSQTWSDG